MITVFLAAMYAILRFFVWMVEALIIFLIVISVVILTYLIIWKIKGGRDEEKED